MKLFIFAVRDRATVQFGNPMFLVSEGQCIRSFTDEVNRADKDNQLFNHADDFDLFRLGSFDTDSGMFDVGVPTQVVTGKSVKV
jgi:hypothetical protein